MAGKMVKKMDFKEAFKKKNWYVELKRLIFPKGKLDKDQLKQFVKFVRTDAFLKVMKEAAKTEDGRENLVKALKDDSLRKILLMNFDSHTVRWAIGDLFNSPDGQEVMKMLFVNKKEVWGKEITYPDLGAAKIVKDIVNAMTTTELKETEIIKDFNHYKKKEKMLHASEEDLKKLEKALSSDKEMNKLLKDVSTKEGREWIIALLRTQEVRSFLNNDVLGDEDKRGRLAKLLKSEAGYGVLDELMNTAEGINVVGFLWNMPNGKKMLKENMTDAAGLKTIYLILNKQTSYNETKEKLKKTPKKKK